MFDRDRNILHIHIPKTGGTSLREVLFPEEKGTFHEVAGDFPAAIWTTAFSLAFVRNPFDRTLSHYAYHVKSAYSGFLLKKYPRLKAFTFEEYVATLVLEPKDKNFFSQVRYITHPESSKPIDFIGRFESLAEDSRKLLKHLGIARELPHTLQSKHAHYSEYFDDTTREMVEAAYKDDLERFGYTFGR